MTVIKACRGAELLQEISARGLPDWTKLFDLHISPSGSYLFFLALNDKRTTIALALGDDPVGRFLNLLGATMAKERGIPKDASKAIKKADEAKDKRLGIKEGSRKDLSEDKKLLKKMGYKKGK